MAFVFEGVVQLTLRKWAGPHYGGETLRQILIESPDLNRYAYLILLSHQRDPAFAFHMRRLMAEIRRPEAQQWLLAE
jgi:hypothetical protein